MLVYIIFATIIKKWYFVLVDTLTKHVLISAGELSGDIHAANLVQAVKAIAPQISFSGMGGDLMRQAGVDIILDARPLSVIGGLEVILKFNKIWRAFQTMKHAIYRSKPDLLILVDYPGFNLRLAKLAKKAGVKVLYFISPKIWAWHQSRIKIIQQCVDLMAVIFPFEVEFYQKRQVPVKFVGNPLLKLIKPQLPITAARQLFGLDARYPTIGLFPGSRLGEIKRLLPIILKATQILRDHHPNLQFLLSQASSLTKQDLEPYLKSSPVKIQIIENKNYDVMQVCDAIIAASGTTTLEIALMTIPLVIIYKISWFEYQIAKRLIKIPYAGLCNILAGKKIAQELLQYEATPEKISQEILKILQNDYYRNEMVSNFQNLRKEIASKEPTDLARLVVEFLTHNE